MTAAATGELPGLGPSRSRRSRLTRRAALITGIVVCIAGGTIAATADPFSGGSSTPTAATRTPAATATITQRSLAAQTQVDATLGYSGTYSVVVPSGTSSQALTQDQQAVANDQSALASAQAAGTGTIDAATVTSAQQALAADQQTLANDQAQLQSDQATLSADQQKEANDCARSGSTGSACSNDESKVAADQQKLNGDNQTLSKDQQTVQKDQASLSEVQAKQSQDASQSQAAIAADQQKLTGDKAALAAANQEATIPMAPYSELPAVGQVISQGQTLYMLGTTPVVLLYGSTPATRNLYQGESGPDVAQLNSDLHELGYSSAPASSDTFDAGTASAVSAFEAHIGVPSTGTLAFGQVEFLPSAARVTAVSATLGAAAQPGATVLEATSTARQVQVALDASQQSDVAVGDNVSITLPNNKITPGVVSSVGTVATCPPGSPSGSSASGSAASGSDSCPSSSTGGSGSTSTPTVTVDITPSDPAATGTWDQAPVQITITTASVANALVVPVVALLTQPGGGYAVEVVDTGGTNHLVPVTLGLFDDADGLVQVSGAGLAAGQKVAVPST